MVQCRIAVERGRAIKQNKARPAFTRLDTTLKNVFFFPPRQYFLLHLRKTYPAFDRVKHFYSPVTVICWLRR